jgi:hypothetical protein
VTRCRDGPYAHTLAAVELSNEPNLFLLNFRHELSARLLGEDFCRFHVAFDVWSVTCDVWHVTCDVWRVACDV